MRLSDKILYISLQTASSIHEVKKKFSGSQKIIQTQMLPLLLELLLLFLFILRMPLKQLNLPMLPMLLMVSSYMTPRL